MLSEKSMQQQRAENNLSNDLTVMSDRIVSLEREKNDIIDKYAKYGQEFKTLLDGEQFKYSEKIGKMKTQVREMKKKVEDSENKARELET